MSVSIGMEILPALQRAQDVGPARSDQTLSVALSMPYARLEEMQALVDSVSNPTSPSYRQFITPDEVGERFGLSTSRVEQVVDYLTQNGFAITLVAKRTTWRSCPNAIEPSSEDRIRGRRKLDANHASQRSSSMSDYRRN